MASSANKSVSRSRSGAKTWKDIDQNVKPRSMSSEARRRIWWGRGKVALASVAALGVVAAVVYFASSIRSVPELLSKAGESLPLNYVEVQSDGGLDRAWAMERLSLGRDANLLSIDVDAIKRSFEAVGQVRSASVTRQFPDTLRIAIQERRPIARIMAQRSSGERLELLADEEGHVFECESIDVALLRSLPYLDGVALKREGEGFARIEGMEKVAKLLGEARLIAPHLYRNWQIVSLKDAPNITVKGRRVKEISFDADLDLRGQLARLDYIIDFYRGRLLSELAHVDLTLGDQVPVKSMQMAR